MLNPRPRGGNLASVTTPAGSPMQNTHVTFVLRCIECAAEDGGEVEGWRAYLLEEELDVLLYCPACATREFGPPRRNRD
jgi:hypothetical protein